MPPPFLYDGGGFSYEELAAYYAQLAMWGGTVDPDASALVTVTKPFPTTQTCPHCSDPAVQVRWTGFINDPCWSCGHTPAEMKS